MPKRELTADDVLSTAARVGWTVSVERAGQIVGTAGPAIATFNRVRGELTFDDHASAFAEICERVKHKD